MNMMSSSSQMELENKYFEWNDEVNFLNIISVVFNNWSDLKTVVDRTSGVLRINAYNDIRTFIQNLMDCVLIYAVNGRHKFFDKIKKGLEDDFHLEIDDLSAKDIGMRIFDMFEKWYDDDNVNENRKQIIEVIKNLPNPNPIVEFGPPPKYQFIFDTEEIMC